MNYELSPNESADASMPIVATAASPAINAGEPAPDGPDIPGYLRDTYTWAYLNPRGVQALDHEIVVKTILWHQHRKLARATFSEIERGSRVLQTACVYGDFSPALAQHIGARGSLDVVDVARIQVENCARKLRDYPFASVRHIDALDLRGGEYDVVCCYFLMHELPDDYKRGLVQVALESIAPAGKVIFVDYHKPLWFNPARLLTGLVFDLLEPYAKSLWRHPISDYCNEPEKFQWRKQTFFGDLFQKVVVTPNGPR